MKHIKLLSLLSVAAFALTGCKKTCSKDEFMDLVNKTEPHQYAKAYAKCKGKVTGKTEGINQTYEPNETFEFTYTNYGWEYANENDGAALGDMKSSIILTCQVLISVNAKNIFESEDAITSTDQTKFTYYSSPLGFNAKSDFKDYKQTLSEYYNIVLNGKSDSTYTFDSNNGAILSYSEKSDIKMVIDMDSMKISSSSVTDMTIEFTYKD